MSILTLTLFSGCTPVEEEKDDTAAASDTDADSDTDSDTDADSDSDTDTSEPEPVITGVEFSAPSATSITTRETAVFTATATWDDGSTSDISEMVTWSSSDEMVLKFYDPGVGQPLWTGTATLTGKYEEWETTADVTVTMIVAATAGDLVINEALVDGSVDGDPNGDGSTSTHQAKEDEFLEIANLSDVTIDLSGVTVHERDVPGLPRHTFDAGTILRAGECIVLFGGGDVSNLSADNASFVIANVEEDLITLLALNNEGDEVTLLAADGSTAITTFLYGDGTDLKVIADASYVLDADIDGTSYTDHSFASGSIGAYSPGTFADGSSFPGPDGRY